MRHQLTLLAAVLCWACASQTANAPAPAPCAPGDVSWGCRATSPSPNQPVTTVAPSTLRPPSPLPPAQATPNNTTPAAPTIVPTSLSAPSPAAFDDAINRADPQFQRARVTALVGELVQALDNSIRGRVERLPLVFDPDRNNVNAFATCTRSGKAAIAITDGMLVLTAYLAQLAASDEVLATRYFDQYVQQVARSQQPNAPILAPPAEWSPVTTRNHPTKVARQHQINDEMIAFVMGHELSHHYLNHLPCTSVLPLDASEIGILLTDVVPALNQPNELAADVAGIRNVLEAGRRRPDYHLTEHGALLSMRFFRALDQASPGDFFTFERTHPPPSIREPVVQTAAQAFRASSGISWPWTL